MLNLLPQANPASALSAEAAVSSARLHNARPPRVVIEHEKPWHRAAALMFAAGAVTAKEVASAFDVSVPTVHNLLRQQWFQERVTQLMAEHGGRDVMTLFKAEGFNSLVTLVEIRDEPKSGAAVRRASCIDILDRAYGKPLQRVEQTDGTHSDNPVAEVARLEAEVKRRTEGLK